MRVLGKGRKERIVPIGHKAREAITRYLEARGDVTPKDPLFLNHRGGRLTARSVQRNLKRQLLTARVIKNATPHALRHSFATHFVITSYSIHYTKLYEPVPFHADNRIDDRQSGAHVFGEFQQHQGEKGLVRPGLKMQPGLAHTDHGAEEIFYGASYNFV